MMFIDSQILLPELVPEFWIEDLLNHESVQKSLLAPPPANPLDPVRDAAKRRLDGIGGLRHPTFSFRPIIDKYQCVGAEVLKIRHCHLVFGRTKDADQSLKTSLDHQDQTHNEHLASRLQCL